MTRQKILWSLLALVATSNLAVVALTPTTPLGLSSVHWNTRGQYRACEKKRSLQLWARVETRDWRQDGKDHERINNLLSQQLPSQEYSFDPEGPLGLDIANQVSMKESYAIEDGGCFLVAVDVDDDDTTIVGTLGMISGTKVMYQSSGSSLSDAQVTAAMRRVCAMDATENGSTILQQLMREGEQRALQSGATSIIGLAYPSNKAAGGEPIVKPSVELFESLGYRISAQQIPGVDTIQYEKELSKTQTPSPLGEAWILPATVVTLVFLAYLVFILYTNVFGIEQFWGSSDNGGLGTSLSTQNLQELIQNEQLGRTDLDDGSLTRQWGDLSPEELREEQALMKVIQGQTIRSK